MPSQLRRAVVAILLEEADPFGSEMSVLRSVEDGPYHSLALDAMSDEERELADRLTRRGLLRRMPARGTFPDRYVVTSGGSHALGTFASDELDVRAWRRSRAAKRVSEGTVDERGAGWLIAQRDRIARWPFEELLRIALRYDPDGAWSDRELEEYGTDHDALVDAVTGWMAETRETPEEWMSRALRSS